MTEPTSEFGFAEDNVTRAFKAVKAFRDALQGLISVSRTAGFTIGLETEGSGETEQAAAEAGSPAP